MQSNSPGDGIPADRDGRRAQASAAGSAGSECARRQAGSGTSSRKHKPFGPRAWLLGAAHAVVFWLVYWLAFQLRFDFHMPEQQAGLFWISLLWVFSLKLVIFYLTGHFHGWWLYVTFSDLAALLRASVLSLLAIATVNHFAADPQIPRSVLILDFILTVVLLGGLRASWRLFHEQFWSVLEKNGRRKALVIGADDSTGILAHQIRSHPQSSYHIQGFVALEGPVTPGARLGQIPVLGSLERLPELAEAVDATEVLVTAGTLPGARLREVMSLCEQGGLNLKIIRSAEDRFEGDRRVPIRDIEISDLLRREPVQLDMESIGELIRGRSVMVTGAGGSIGSEICRQAMRFEPRTLVLVGNGENPIFRIEKELAALGVATRLKCCIGDVTDGERMRQIFQAHRPEVVFHAAAHKHVPLMEANVGQAVKNNVLGTKCLADLANELGVDNFVLISTDKAVHPTSVMGATKQIAERYVHALSQDSSTRFTVVRFGNVLGSDGSVVPLFQEQIRRGGPITITDPRMRRFFMTIPEASQLVLQAAAMGRGGEIFVLEMGEPVRIVDLARDLIRLSGLPEDSIELVFTGIRPGEKLYEELYFEEEQTLPTSHPKVRAAYHRPFQIEDVRAAIAELQQSIHMPEDELRKKIRRIVPEFNPPDAKQRPPAPEPAPAEPPVQSTATGVNPPT